MPHRATLVPESSDVYLVLEDFGRLGRAWRETDEAGTSRATLIRNLIDEQYENPVRVVAFNTMEGYRRRATPTLRGVQRGTGLDPQLYGSPPALIGGTTHPPSLFLLDGRYPL